MESSSKIRKMNFGLKEIEQSFVWWFILKTHLAKLFLCHFLSYNKIFQLQSISLHRGRGVFRAMSNTYDKDFLQKYLTAKSRCDFSLSADQFFYF